MLRLSLLIASTGLVSLGMAAPASAAPARSADDYVCALSGSCGGQPAADQSKDAPATKGFSLGVRRDPAADQSKDAPQTKGFSLGVRKSPAPDQAVNAPKTKGFSLGTKTQTATPARPATTRAAPTRQVRTAANNTARPAVTPARKVDLQLSFKVGSADLTDSAQDQAKAFAEALKRPELAGKRFLIAGHTDAKGSRTANVDLSERRAAAVADYLASQGVDRARLDVKGYGPDKPLPGKRASDPANRRVEAEIL